MPLFRSDVRVPLQALLKRFVVTYLLIVVVFSVAGWMLIRFEEQRRAELAEIRESSRVEVARGLIAQDFSAVTSDLRLMANLPLLKRYLDDGYPSQLTELAHYFLVVAQGGRRYDQVRYLDAHGQEIIRINYNGGEPSIVPREQLQNKSSRYFFRDAIKLGEGEIYVSPLDLNVEHDRLEIPYKPVIRFGTPVFDSSGRKKGVILLNYLGSNLLHHFRDTMGGGSNHHQSMLLNQKGYWLSSDRHEDEWGFMLGRSESSFAHEFAEEWLTISVTERGVVKTEQGLFAFTTVRPLQPGQSSSTGETLSHVASQRPLSGREYYWKVVSFVPAAILAGDFFYNQAAGRKLLAGIYSSFALMAALVAYATLIRRQADVLVRESEARLREITGTMSDGLLVTDDRGRISFANPEACQLLGFAPKELVGANKHELMHVDAEGRPFPSEQCKILQVARAGEVSRGVEETFRKKDGTLLPVSTSAAPIIREQAMVGIVVAFHDITELKRAQEALRKSAEDVEDLYEHAPCGYHSLDQNGLFVRINHTELQWLGYSRD